MEANAALPETQGTGKSQRWAALEKPPEKNPEKTSSRPPDTSDV